MNIDISIITVNYNGLDDTCALIDTIPFNDYALEVIVVDNASKTNEAAVLAKRYKGNPSVVILRSEVNLGFAGGNNLALRQAKGKYLYFINNDTLLYLDSKTTAATGRQSATASHFHSLVKRLESSPKIGMVCPKIRFAWGDTPIQFAGYTPLSKLTIRNRSIGYGEADHQQYDTPHPTPYAHGAAMMVKREVIDKVGGLPECYFLYYEELDWSLMITNGGYEIWYEPLSTIFHKESQSTGQNSPLRTYYISRNRLLFVRRNIKSFSKYLTYLYLIGIVTTRDLVKYTLQGRADLTKAALRGLKDFFFTISKTA